MSSFIEIADPRSPSMDFPRTPLRVVKKIIDEENISTETRLPADSFVNVSSENGSMTPAPVAVGQCNNDTDDSFHSAFGENDSDPLISSTDSTGKVKGKRFRRALGCIKNSLTETPIKSDMRRKLWRNMKDERVIKGVQGGLENTPPLPFNDITASAPPKLYRRKYT